MKRNEINVPLKTAMRKTGTPQWKLADLLGCHENTVNRLLRHELPKEEQDRLIAMVEEEYARSKES